MVSEFKLIVVNLLVNNFSAKYVLYPVSPKISKGSSFNDNLAKNKLSKNVLNLLYCKIFFLSFFVKIESTFILHLPFDKYIFSFSSTNSASALKHSSNSNFIFSEILFLLLKLYPSLK